ncbi:MAG TPA: efflux RND transporter periplasmic adaptor subunit [Anaerolineales bacterium]
MKSKLFTLIIIIALGSLFLSACGSIGAPADDAAPTEIPIVITDTDVVAEGRLVPNDSANLSFKAAGQVTEILITEGDTVEAGQVIARLDNSEQLQSAIANAEAELLNAQLARDALFDNAKVNSAAALQAIADARDAVRDSDRYLNNLNAGSRDTDIDLAKADVAILKDQLDEAQEDYKPYENKPEDDLKRATFLARFAQAEQLYKDAVRKLNNLQGEPSKIDLDIAEANQAVAEAQLLLALQNYDEIASGPDPDDLAAVEARIKAAEAGLVSAQATLNNIELVAPFDGKIVDLVITTGEQVAPGVTAAVLADFSQWIVETDDLTEIEVPEISIGQSVTIVPDALPDLELTGTVERISDVFEEKRGDITYTARIKLNEENELLRWGMTVVVTFEK